MIKAKKSRDIQEKKKKKTRRSLGPRSQVIMGTREGIHNGMQEEGGSGGLNDKQCFNWHGGGG